MIQNFGNTRSIQKCEQNPGSNLLNDLLINNIFYFLFHLQTSSDDFKELSISVE